jgi:hypothetical protein
MKIPVVSGIVLLGTTLLASSCSAAPDAVPSQYTLTARMSSRWFSANGELLPIESSTYPPEEIDIRVSERTAGAEQVESSIEAVSPSYYFGRHRVRLPFEGPRSTRKLWTLVITENTNWHGVLLPSKFRYTRYLDPADRVRAENRKPIVLITGSLVSAKLGADTDIRPRLAEELSVADVRVTSALGRAVRYRAKPGAWPEINSKEYDKLIEANLPWPPPEPLGGR